MDAAKLTAILELHKNWFNGEDGGVRADLRDADLSDADLSRADLRDADLSDADLSRANLRGADLRDADLSDADLSDADLRGADLRRADLRGADLSGANLRDADLRRAENLPLQIEDGLIQKIAIAVNADEKSLEMNTWHTCETTHCIAGWAVNLSPNGKELEDKVGTQIAGLMLLGVEAHSHFFDSNEDGKKYLSQFLGENHAN